MHSHVYALETCRNNTKHYPTVTNTLNSKTMTIFITTYKGILNINWWWDFIQCEWY